MKRNWGKIRRFIPMYLMLLPGLVYLFINNYMPMAGIIIAFKKYNYSLGIPKSFSAECKPGNWRNTLQWQFC